MTTCWLGMAYRVHMKTFYLCVGFSLLYIQASVAQEGCIYGTTFQEPKDDWMEMEVVMGFRVWQLMFLALAGLITVVVLLCCFMKCRVPRTKQEIEADFKRKEVTRRFRFLLDKIPIEDTSLRTALDKVNQLYSNREKMKRKKKKKLDEEETCSFDSSELFTDEKLTIIERIKHLLRLQKDEESEVDDSSKDKSDKSDGEPSPSQKAKRSDDEDDDDEEEESQGTTKSPHTDGSHVQRSDSRDSEMLDSPKPGDLQSRMSLLQDSPPHVGLSLLEESPPSSTTRVVFSRGSQSEESSPPEVSSPTENNDHRKRTTTSRDAKSEFPKRLTDSLESQSRDSETGGNSQGSHDSVTSKVHKKKSDSLESHSDSRESRHQQSDSIDSRSSETLRRSSITSHSRNNKTIFNKDSISGSSGASRSNGNSSKPRKSKEHKLSKSSTKSSTLESKPKNSFGETGDTTAEGTKDKPRV